jgi:hypothetical protein
MADRERQLLLAAVGALALLTAATRAHAEPVRIGIYAPWAGPSTADERHGLGLAIERALADGGHGSAVVASYARLRDFRRAIAAGRVDLAVVDSAAAAITKLDIVASWSSGKRWVLAGGTGARLGPKQRLALQATDASTSIRLVTRLLRGQAPRSYWSAIVGAPVTTDARELVRRGKADIVALPEHLAAELVELVDLGDFTELVLAVRPGRADQSVVTVTQKVVSDTLGGSWRRGKPSFPTAVGHGELVVAAPTTARPSLLDLLVPLAIGLPDLELAEMWMDGHDQ